VSKNHFPLSPGARRRSDVRARKLPENFQEKRPTAGLALTGEKSLSQGCKSTCPTFAQTQSTRMQRSVPSR
jgi:hypothetical protein